MTGLIAATIEWDLTGTLTFGLISTAIVLLVGIYALRARDTLTAVVTAVISHTVGAVALLVCLGSIVPHYRVIFNSFGVELPRLSVMFIRASDWSVGHLDLLAPLVAMLVLADALNFLLLHKTESTRTLAKIWSACITVFWAMAVLLSIASVVGPARALVRGLE